MGRPAYVVVAACAASLVVSGIALAANAPPEATKPVVAGTPQVGATLTASATWTGSPAPEVEWTWRRCVSEGSCKAIKGVTGATYVATADDLGQLLQARITLTNSAGTDDKKSKPTAAVVAAPPAPTPTPTPAPTPTPTPTPTDDDPPTTFEVDPVPATTAPAPGPAQSHGMPLLEPFPLIRIKGVLTARGARLTLITVRAPRGARIRVTCAGRSCPKRSMARTAAVSRLRPFERSLRGGTRLGFTVTKAGFVGKWTSIVIRVGLPPKRSDGCLDSGTKKHVSCPGA
jgi:hypothetical protein